MYKGPPSPESDAAWTELVDPTNIRLEKSTLEKINRTALELSDHSGYHGGMGVHHHLHCLVSSSLPYQFSPFRLFPILF